jgi:sugar phosphate isomerase/epimerase
MGVPHVLIDAGSEIPESMNHSEAWDLFVAGMIRVLPLAQKLGRKLLFLPRPNAVIETSGQTLALLKELKEYDCLGVSFDVGHLFCVGEDPLQAWKDLKQFVCYIHLEDAPETRLHRHIQLGDGAIDIIGFLNLVRDSGYEDYVTIKLDSYDQRAEEVVIATARYLQASGFSLD